LNGNIFRRNTKPSPNNVEAWNVNEIFSGLADIPVSSHPEKRIKGSASVSKTRNLEIPLPVETEEFLRSGILTKIAI
jgi:hypothetical protein